MEGEITRWEYKILPLNELYPNESGEKKLNQLGAEGWELAVAPKPNITDAELVFKRPMRRSYDDGRSR